MNVAWLGGFATRAMAVGLLGFISLAVLGPALADPTIRLHDFAGIAPVKQDEKGRFQNKGGPIVQAGPSVTLPFFVRRVAARFRTPIGRSLAIHYGTFDLSDEPHDEPPGRFRDAMAANGVADEAVWIIDIGESRRF